MQAAAWVEKVDDRFGHLAIPHVTRYLVGLHLATYILNILNPDFANCLLLDGYSLRFGEVWRVATFMFVPQLDNGPVWFFCYLWFTWFAGDSLEHEWGAGKVNLYYLIGIIALVAAALWWVEGPVRCDLLMISLVLPFGTLFPDIKLLLFFILSIEARYIAMFYGGFIALAFLLGFMDRAVVLASMMPYILFFGPSFWADWRLQQEVKERRRRFEEK